MSSIQTFAILGLIAAAALSMPGQAGAHPLKDYRTVSAVMVKGTRLMWDQGPGGGHYENIKGNHATAGCGIHITAAGNVWVVQDFR